MPRVFQHTKSDSLNKDGKTRFLAPVGPGTLFSDNKGKRFAEVTDGLSNTLMLVEVDEEHAVEWTKPDDLEYDSEKPLTGLADDQGAFLALFADGSVKSLSRKAEKAIAALFTFAGGEVVQWSELEVRK
jgi:hypothetical protein